MIRRSDIQADQLRALESGLFGSQNITGVIFSNQLNFCIGNCKLHIQGFLKNNEDQKLDDNC